MIRKHGWLFSKGPSHQTISGSLTACDLYLGDLPMSYASLSYASLSFICLSGSTVIC